VAGAATQADFRAFLELPDPEIAAYLMGHSEPAEARLRALVGQIREHRPVSG
jgi:succinate dehydrogenase flavin-adding protein (antitoxin of CptAB toxin-antitoxin module)